MSAVAIPDVSRLAVEPKPLRTFYLVTIPEEEGPMDCAENCPGIAVLFVTSDLEHRRQALCANHANLAMAEWMCSAL